MTQCPSQAGGLAMLAVTPFSYEVPCTQCPLRACEVFRTISDDEIDFIATLKTGELRTGPGTTVLREGSPSEQLFTLLEGWAFRYKTLDDGRRQITSFVLPGDLIGLQSSIQGEMDHSVDTLTAAALCAFPRNRVWEIYKRSPSLAFDVTWLAATQEMVLNENLLSVGRRNAVECAAYFTSFTFTRVPAMSAS
jgi:CRP/FNR family transcriptional regulator